MARLRSQKMQFSSWLEGLDWKEHIQEIAEGGMASVGPLLSFLMYEPVIRMRAAIALGETTAQLFATKEDLARDILRRLMWRLSEESGNIGWGVPEAFGEILSRSAPLAKDFHNILFSTILNLGFDDNYCDNDVLRRSCYFAIGRFIAARPEYGEKVRPLLRKGLNDTDPVCQGTAAWALSKLKPDLNDTPALRALAESGNNASCLITDGNTTELLTASQIAERILKNA